jgi:hypothetical protein
MRGALHGAGSVILERPAVTPTAPTTSPFLFTRSPLALGTITAGAIVVRDTTKECPLAAILPNLSRRNLSTRVREALPIATRNAPTTIHPEAGARSDVLTLGLQPEFGSLFQSRSNARVVCPSVIGLTAPFRDQASEPRRHVHLSPIVKEDRPCQTSCWITRRRDYLSGSPIFETFSACLF